MIRFAGGTPIPMQLHERLGYNPDLKELENQITSKTKLIIVNSPNNPCGSVIPRTDLQKISFVGKFSRQSVQKKHTFQYILNCFL